MSSSHTRVRDLPFADAHATATQEDYNSVKKGWVTKARLLRKPDLYMGKQITVSESHPWPPQTGGLGDIGGAFNTTKQYAICNDAHYNLYQPHLSPSGPNVTASRGTCAGLLRCPFQTTGSPLKPAFPSNIASSDSALNTLGATAISRVRPTGSAVDLSTALGELWRDGLPHRSSIRGWKDRTDIARKAGNDYLNLQFGWRPLISDITNFGKAALKSRSILDQYERDAGRVVRRSYTFSDIVTAGTETVLSTAKVPSSHDGLAGPLVPDLDYGGGITGGKWTKQSTTSIKRWFSGAFVYGGPSGILPDGALRDTVAEADKLFGLSLTPDVLWNLTPWSWAIDWFTNTGDVLKTASDMISQGLVMQYGYMMEHSIAVDTYTLSGVKYNDYTFPSCSVQLVTETKKRIKANPFGFGFTWDGLSPFQISILAALGITRT
jgi:hypothetical protein